MANASISDPAGAAPANDVPVSADHGTHAANNEAVLASAAEGRRLYIGNLAYATTETELKEFFTGYLV